MQSALVPILATMWCREPTFGMRLFSLADWKVVVPGNFYMYNIIFHFFRRAGIQGRGRIPQKADEVNGQIVVCCSSLSHKTNFQ